MTSNEQKMAKALYNVCVLKGNIRDLRETLGADSLEVRDDLEMAYCDVIEADIKLMRVVSKCGLSAAL